MLIVNAFNMDILSFLLLWSVSNLLSRLLIFYMGNSLYGDCCLNLSFLLLLLFFEASLLFDLLPFSLSLLLLLADLLGLSLLKELLNAVLFSTLLVFLFLKLAAESLSSLGAQGLHFMLGTQAADLIVTGGFLSFSCRLRL